MSGTGDIPLSLYVHFPWCVAKCPYCDFNSHAANNPDFEGYVSALARDIAHEAPQHDGRAVQTIFFGGGTPSLVPARLVAKTMRLLRASFAIPNDAEVTLEANPGTFDLGQFQGFREAGINRLSLGVQSFDDAMLKRLGRIHDAHDARRAIDAALTLFSRVNIDLMHGTPGQTEAHALRDLKIALDSGVRHLSWYELTIEANTLFYRTRPALPNEDDLHAIEQSGADALSSQGFRRYEVSAWARDREDCRHNVNYWSFGDYVGLGAGAHGKVSHRVEGELRVSRYSKSRIPVDYVRDPTRRHEASIPDADLPLEFLLNALRLTEGASHEVFRQRTGLSVNVLEPTLSALRGKALLEGDRLATTPLGFQFLDSVLAEFTSH